jgi:hypothetical protein
VQGLYQLLQEKLREKDEQIQALSDQLQAVLTLVRSKRHLRQ